jgi:NAD(P)H-flavin reductase
MEAEGIRSLCLNPEREKPFECGQFFFLSVAGVGEAPLTPLPEPTGERRIRFSVRKRGAVTSALHALNVGDYLGIRGPYGKPFPMERLYGKSVLVVAEGLGILPARAFIRCIAATTDRYAGATLLVGAPSEGEQPFSGEMRALGNAMKVRMVPAAQAGEGIGLMADAVPERFDDPSRTAALVFASAALRKAVAEKLGTAGVPADAVHLWIERKMVCGVGHCRHCTVDHVFTCTEGPMLPLGLALRLREAWA